MKVIIAGSRWPFKLPAYQDWGRALIMRAFKESGFWKCNVEEFVTGAAPGIDLLAGALVLQCGLPLKQMPAQWRFPDGSHNLHAGFERNEQMALYVKSPVSPLFGDEQTGGLLAVWNGYSDGTKHMISRARHHGLRVHVLVIDQVPVINLATGTLSPMDVGPKGLM